MYPYPSFHPAQNTKKKKITQRDHKTLVLGLLLAISGHRGFLRLLERFFVLVGRFGVWFVFCFLVF